MDANNAGPAFRNSGVKAAYDAFHPANRAYLLALRTLALATARETAGVGTVVEALKWGQPAFVTENGIGSTFRLGELKPSAIGEAPAYAAFFLCQTRLVGGFRDRYGDVLRLEGNRAIVFDSGEKFQSQIMRHCFAQALTYNRHS